MPHSTAAFTEESVQDAALSRRLQKPAAIAEGIPKATYERVVKLIVEHADVTGRLRQVTQALLDCVLLHLDPVLLGMAVTVAQLMPARDGKGEDGYIHSLREIAMRGNAPWPYTTRAKAFLGSTTLAGMVVRLQRTQVWNNELTDHQIVTIDEFERSSCVAPLTRGGGLTAGVLIISSSQPHFFDDPHMQVITGQYADLLSIAIPDSAFYPLSLLRLHPMPDLQFQRKVILESFADRVLACAREQELTAQDAEKIVERDMEKEFEELARQQMPDREHDS
ncbi:MAG: GAF domain-containing protein [Ktedonobacteraceae bacterium]|nr:GAF domain-containing protein [Ktedonobacteraceae bacterium]